MQSPTIRAFQNSWGHEWANVVTSSKKSWKVSIDMTYRLSSFPKKYKNQKMKNWLKSLQAMQFHQFS